MKRFQVGGTAFYTAPEVLNGNQPSKSTDQYSLAITYYHLLTGLLPFDSKSPTGAMLAHLYGKLDFENRPDHHPPEIERADLAGLLLDLRAAGLDPWKLPWLDPHAAHPPHPQDVQASGQRSCPDTFWRVSPRVCDRRTSTQLRAV